MSVQSRNIFLTGGAGYVGSVLVPKLLAAGHRVKVYDLYLFGDNVLKSVADHPGLIQIKADIRDEDRVRHEMQGCDSVIHLACISNDPSFELDPQLGKSINYDAFFGVIRAARENRINRFVYASSSSVYGIKDTVDVTEDLDRDPLTDYSKYKAMCEDVLMAEKWPGLVTLILRPATVCGYSPRLRLDLTVNILTNHAVNNGKITVFGGSQMRPNLHIEDMTDLYVQTMAWPDEAIDGKIYNAGYENHTVSEIANRVRTVVGDHVIIETTPTDDNRSYHVSSDKIKRELGFEPGHTIYDAIRDLVTAFDEGRIPSPMTDKRYYNIKTMQAISLK